MLSWVPFLGGLRETSRRDHLAAVRELFLGQLVATMPIWVGAIHVSWPQVEVTSLLDGVREIGKNGEFFIYAASTLAPIIYIVTREREIPRVFPNKYLYIGIVMIGTIVATTVFTLQRETHQLISDSTFTLSLFFYLFATTILYLAYAYNNTYLPDPAQAMRRDEEAYAERLRNHR